MKEWQRDAEKDAVLELHLKKILPAFSKLKIDQARTFIDAANDCLKGTPFMYLITGDGVMVALRSEMVELSKAMFDGPYIDNQK